MSDIDTIPAAIVKAIATIKAHAEAVKKSEYNKHGGYNFSSTDDIYAAVARKMGEVGLITLPLELRHDRVTIDVPDKDKSGNFQYDKQDKIIMKKTHWLDVEIGFVLACEDATWFDKRSKRSEFVQYTGPQTAQTVVSYAEKAFLRSLFKLPTGDKDLDSMPQGETVESQVSLNQPVKRKSSNAAKKDGATTELFNEIRREIAASINADHLKHLRAEVYAEDWATMPVKWVELLDHEYEDRLDTFNAEAA